MRKQAKYDPEYINTLGISDAAKFQKALEAYRGWYFERNYGDEARNMMLEAREIQSDAAKGALRQVAGTELGPNTGPAAAKQIRNVLSESYKTAKANTRAKYKTVGEMQTDAPLKIGAEFIKENVIPSLENWARKGGSGTGFDLSAPSMSYAKRLYNEGVAVAKMDKITSVNFNRAEKWRGRVSQALADAKTKLQPGITDNPETVFLKGMMDRFDEAFEALPREAIKSGDVAILDALDEARKARKFQGQTFERNKVIMDVLKNDDITNEQLVNVLFSGKGRAYNAESSANLQKIIKAAGNKGPDVLNAAKAGTYAKIMRNSLTSEIKQGSAVEEMVSFDKLRSPPKSPSAGMRHGQRAMMQAGCSPARLQMPHRTMFA